MDRPRRILVATDLTPSCDRAIERAVRLATEWNAELVVTHALQDDGTSRDEALELLRADLGDAGGRAVDLVLEYGDPVTLLSDTARRLSCELIICGPGAARSPWALVIGSTTERLLPRSPAPVLVVRRRAFSSYQSLVVASDFSAAAQRALQVADGWWPDAALTVFHACEAPFSSRGGLSPVGRDAAVRTATAQGQRHLDETPGLSRRPRLVVEHGHPGLKLDAHAFDARQPLVVLGTEARTGLEGLLLGSVAARLLPMLHADTLVVGPPAAR